MTTSTLTQPPQARQVGAKGVWLINNARDLAAFMRDRLSDTMPEGAMWDEITHAAAAFGREPSTRWFAAEIEGYVEDHCLIPRCDWCGFVECVSTCCKPAGLSSIDEESARG